MDMSLILLSRELMDESGVSELEYRSLKLEVERFCFFSNLGFFIHYVSWLSKGSL